MTDSNTDPIHTPQVLGLPADLGIEHAESLKHMLIQRVQEPGSITLSGSAVQRLHTSTLQLLLAFVRSRESADLSFCWADTSPVLLQAATHLGLSESLRLNP